MPSRCDFPQPSLTVPGIALPSTGLPTIPSLPSRGIPDFELEGVPEPSLSIPGASLPIPGVPALPSLALRADLPGVSGPVLVAPGVPGLPIPGLPAVPELPARPCPLDAVA